MYFFGIKKKIFVRLKIPLHVLLKNQKHSMSYAIIELDSGMSYALGLGFASRWRYGTPKV